jgi:5-methylcytosine-specific restriction enzyme A
LVNINAQRAKGDIGMDVCQLCGRSPVETTVHHLLPREMGGSYGPTANLCIPCHKHIHAVYTNEELAARLSSLQELREDETIARFIKWIRKQPPSKIMKIKKSNERRRKGK